MNEGIERAVFLMEKELNGEEAQELAAWHLKISKLSKEEQIAVTKRVAKLRPEHMAGRFGDNKK